VTTIVGVELLVLLAVGLLLGGVVGSVVPLVPGALLSLGGVYLYWWHTGYADPGLLVLAALTLVGIAAFLVDVLAGALAASLSGASRRTTAVAGVVGGLLFLVAGPVGVLLGVAGTVFMLERQGGATPRESLRIALGTTVGVLGSAVVQVLLTLSILVAMVLVILL
jgi:uncharacterized protein YqgC (DUF456 family)